jgi:hypothetical protein
MSLPPELHPHGLQVPALDLYHQLAKVDIDMKDVAYAVDRLATGLRTVRYNHIAVHCGHIRNRRVKEYLLAIKGQTNRI